MFIIEELKNIDHTYFNVIQTGSYCVTLQSKNTKHYWHILHQQYPTFTSCKIWHKHKQAYAFHEQGSAPTLEKAIDKIRDHDHYHLYIRKESHYGKKKQKSNRIRRNKRHTLSKHTTDQATG